MEMCQTMKKSDSILFAKNCLWMLTIRKESLKNAGKYPRKKDNRINGVYAANSRDLCTILAREEWGFGGVIMSDWNTTVPENGSVSWKCIAAGNDIIMPGNSNDDQNIRQAYEKGELSEEAIRSSAGKILAMIWKLSGKN